MKENTKVLYIQGFRLFGKSLIQQKLERAIGENNVFLSKLNMQSQLLSLLIFILLIIIVIAFNVYILYSFVGEMMTGIAAVISIILIISLYCIGINLILYYIMKKAIKLAEENISINQPDVIIGSFFGGVVAMNLNYKKGNKPLILISPSFKTYQKYTQKNETDLSKFPYVIIVNGTKDKKNKLGTCEKLMSSVFPGKGRLEVIEDNHSYSKIKESDFKAWISEAKYNALKEENSVKKMKKNILHGKTIVCSLALSTDQLISHSIDTKNYNSEKEPFV